MKNDEIYGIRLRGIKNWKKKLPAGDYTEYEGFSIDWEGPRGCGGITFYTDGNQVYVNTEFLGKDFARMLINKLIKESIPEYDKSKKTHKEKEYVIQLDGYLTGNASSHNELLDKFLLAIEKDELSYGGSSYNCNEDGEKIHKEKHKDYSFKWKPQQNIMIDLDDKTSENRSSEDLSDMIYEIRQIANKYDFDLSSFGSRG
ncbi:MAG: hypothetical protein ACOCP8_01225 [archaeon]